MDTWTPAQGLTSTESVIAALRPWLTEAEGITVSGGEPFDQPYALKSLLQELRGLTSVDVLVYSGYPINALTEWLRTNPRLIDALISEPYVAAAKRTLPLRGSDNQRLYFISELGRDRFLAFNRPIRAADRRLDVMFDEDGSVWLAGIPQTGDFHRLRQMFRASGHTADFSDTHTAEVSS